MSVIALNGFQSVQYNYEHFIQNVSDFKLKSYYYALNKSKLNIDDWLLKMVHTAASLIPDCLKEHPVILSADDTMTEKSGEQFEYCSVLFDHAVHNGSSYLNGHCFVSLMISVPVMENGVIQYISIPVGYRMWTKEETKLKMAADLVKLAMQEIKDTGMRAGFRTVMTNLFKKCPVSAIVTESNSDSRKLFLCTASPEQLHFDTVVP